MSESYANMGIKAVQSCARLDHQQDGSTTARIRIVKHGRRDIRLPPGTIIAHLELRGRPGMTGGEGFNSLDIRPTQWNNPHIADDKYD